MPSYPGLQTTRQWKGTKSQSKDNQIIMKFGQLTEHNKRDTFLQKLCGKWGKGTSSRPLSIF